MAPPKSKPAPTPPPIEDASTAQTVVVDPLLAAARADVVDAVDWESKLRAAVSRQEELKALLTQSEAECDAAWKARDAAVAQLKQASPGGKPLRCVHCGNRDLESVPWA